MSSRALSASVDTELTDDVLETRFRRLRRFMAVIRPDPDAARGRTTQRDAVLDVRRHMEITAVPVRHRRQRPRRVLVAR
ncbi:hypothetical protein Q9Q99_02645 [Curtobacterium flaccumfaciens]|nr:hypothetical protein Q9Q99_02645 [Curtobacterium flaccumfaciens]